LNNEVIYVTKPRICISSLRHKFAIQLHVTRYIVGSHLSTDSLPTKVSYVE